MFLSVLSFQGKNNDRACRSIIGEKRGSVKEVAGGRLLVVGCPPSPRLRRVNGLQVREREA